MDKIIDELPDDVIQYMAQAFTSYETSGYEGIRDEDGFSNVTLQNFAGFDLMQKECWNKFNKNPQLNSHVRDFMGSLTGYGFTVDSNIAEIADVLYEETYDMRNELHKFLPKFVARSEVEGELFLALSVHEDGFVEVDFMEPSALKGGGDYNSGIYYHPKKQTMPLFYQFSVKDNMGREVSQVFPSIYLAHYPEFSKEIPKEWKITEDKLKFSKGNSRKYKELGGFKTFIISWDRGFLTPRNLSHISTTIEWINHYVNLKKWEIDHKKSAGAYLWVVTMEDAKAFRTWLKMTPEQRAETGLTAKKTPGGTLILPPGIQINVKNPDLPSISEQDNDIMHMITSGLNKPEDMVTGQTKGDTFSGVKASRGPQSDRTQDQIAYFERFLRYDFWRGVFVLKNKMVGFKLQYKINEAFDFIDKEPKFKKVNRFAWDLIDFDFPTSEISDVEAKARAYLGVKHPSIVEVLGIPRGVVAKKLGFGSYWKKRLQFETENEELPDLPSTAELELQAQQNTMQEEGLPGDKPGETPVKKPVEKKPVEKKPKVK